MEVINTPTMQNPTPEQVGRGVVGVLDGVEIFDPKSTPAPEGVFRHGRRKRRNDRTERKAKLEVYGEKRR